MKYDGAAGFTLLERQRKNVLLRNAFNNQAGKASEAEPVIVSRISNKHAAFCTQRFQRGQTFMHQGFSYALLL